MRDKFGTNERNIMNVMDKRDWSAFSEMIQFGYRMNRKQKNNETGVETSALSKFLDRVPANQFNCDDIENMVLFGANINDKCIKPKDENDNDEPNKIGDNVLIRYIKITPIAEINEQFEDVVVKWSTQGIVGGDYNQKRERICVDLNAKNENGYTAFKVYWEKAQYLRRQKLRERKYILEERKWHKLHYEYDLKKKRSSGLFWIFDASKVEDIEEKNTTKREQSLDVVKFLIDELKCSVQPQSSSNIIFEYMKVNRNNLNNCDWDLLDFFYNEPFNIPFKMEDDRRLLRRKNNKERPTFLRLYYEQIRRFDCVEFKQLMEKYDLKSTVLYDKAKYKEKKKTTIFSYFLRKRTKEITPDIIELFVEELNFDVNESIDGFTPLIYYCREMKKPLPSVIDSFIEHGASFEHEIKKSEKSVADIIVRGQITNLSLNKLDIMIQKYGIKLMNAEKRNDDIWRNSLGNYSLIKAAKIFVSAEFEPIHLFDDNETDKSKSVKNKLYYLYKVEAIDDDKEIIDNASKYNGDLVWIYLKQRSKSIFSTCRAPESFSRKRVQIPTSWLVPISFKEFIKIINEIEKKQENFDKAKKIAQSVVVDMPLINKITSLLPHQHLINNIYPDKKYNILMRYLKTNPPSQISAKDIDQMKEFGIDFKYKRDKYDALCVYCLSQCQHIDKSVVLSLLNGGCSINVEVKEDEIREDRTRLAKTPLILYCESPKANITGFKALFECGADPKLEYGENNAIVYLLVYSTNLDLEFITYLISECDVKFDEPLSGGTLLFNLYLSRTKIEKETIRILCQIAGCDPNACDKSGRNAIRAYCANKGEKALEALNVGVWSDFFFDKKKVEQSPLPLDFDIIRYLVELGAQINEADKYGVYPIQSLLENSFKLSVMFGFMIEMVGIGATLQHILPNDPLTIQYNKLYILQDIEDVKEEYEYLNGFWCTLTILRSNNNYDDDDVRLFAWDETQNRSEIGLKVKRSNLIDVTNEMLIKVYPQFVNVFGSDNKQAMPQSNIIEEEEKEEEEEINDDEFVL